MGVRILRDKDGDQACLYCSTVGWAFGPVFFRDEESGLDAGDKASAFLAWLKQTDGRDARVIPESELEGMYGTFLVALDKAQKCLWCGDYFCASPTCERLIEEDYCRECREWYCKPHKESA